MLEVALVAGAAGTDTFSMAASSTVPELLIGEGIILPKVTEVVAVIALLIAVRFSLVVAITVTGH